MANEDKSPNEWRTIAGLAAELGVSDRTIRRRIDSGKYEAKKEGGKILINFDGLDARGGVMADKVSKDQLIDILRTQVTELRGQLQQKDEQIRALQKHLDEASHRHDTVVMQMTRLLEYHQQPFWRRLFHRKQLPTPVDETTMGMGADREKETSGL